MIFIIYAVVSILITKYISPGLSYNEPYQVLWPFYVFLVSVLLIISVVRTIKKKLIVVLPLKLFLFAIAAQIVNILITFDDCDGDNPNEYFFWQRLISGHEKICQTANNIGDFHGAVIYFGLTFLIQFILLLIFFFSLRSVQDKNS